MTAGAFFFLLVGVSFVTSRFMRFILRFDAPPAQTDGKKHLRGGARRGTIRRSRGACVTG